MDVPTSGPRTLVGRVLVRAAMAAFAVAAVVAGIRYVVRRRLSL